MKFFHSGLFLCLLLVAILPAHAQDKSTPVLIFENGGLKNNYRVVFEAWDDANHFASGALEISSNDSDVVHTRIPFSAEVKTDPSLRSIPVVVLTTSKSEEDVFRTYDLGVNSFITKPVSFEGLVEVVRILGHYWFEIVELPART